MDRRDLLMWLWRRPGLVAGATTTAAGVAAWAAGRPQGRKLTMIGTYTVLFFWAGDTRRSLYLGWSLPSQWAAERAARRGDYEDALSEVGDQVTTLRRLAFARPRETVRLAWALDFQWRMLRKLERYEDALPIAEEAATLWRELAAEDPGRRSRLRGALSNLNATVARLDMDEDTLRVAEEAVMLERRLIAENQSELARTLLNLALSLRVNERYDDALPVVQEEVTLRRTAADADPASRPQLADALDSLRRTLQGLNRLDDAIDIEHQEVRIRRELAIENPDRRQDLIDTVEWLVAALRRQNRREEADRFASELTALRRGEPPGTRVPAKWVFGSDRWQAGYN